MNASTFELLRVVSVTFVTFVIAMAWAPGLIRLLRALNIKKQIRDASKAPIMAALHAAKAGTPTMGGILIWLTVLGVTLGASMLGPWNFLSRTQTLLPLGAFIAAALVGLVDDYLNMKRIGPNGGGLRARHKLISYALIAVFGAW